ncbi:alpha-beta hydrolase superfamily lysophospholipase [Litoreibacter ponti]|uniref:Alpha-beta hydrolase superfamily lysophospholipase n=1 Tax=Litoreibacter ponti TaxID=1510457 RepID=A0A2T6BNU0_9RHOB|nr:alpha/beta hydrolase [Litoreibacter ponti]PTX57704.1 alpha-beta hydrolase superfamily lysophospholipase [Litoreibacter ponti]
MFRRTILPAFGLVLLALALLVVALRLSAMQRETVSRDDLLPARGEMVNTSMGAVYVDARGPEEGVPVLLVHGSVGWAGFWGETSDALAAAGYRAIAFDLSPMGFSDRDPKADYTRPRQAQRILSLIRALNIKPILLAHSFGAGPGVEALMDTPDRFRAAVIVAGALGVGSEPAPLPAPLRPAWVREAVVSATITNPPALPYLLAMFLHKKDRATPEYVDILTTPYPREGTTEAIADWLPTLLSTVPEARSIDPEAYPRIDLPITLIWGEEDTATPIAQGEWLRDTIPGSSLIRLPDLGHIPQIEDPAVFQKALLDALGQL